ncbi:hypothetical protein QW180_31180 [Vibrio sinaloensis]|nr:hypothetical protein [Vibrio sinaloensis]
MPALGQLFVDTHELGKMLSTIDKKKMSMKVTFSSALSLAINGIA